MEPDDPINTNTSFRHLATISNEEIKTSFTARLQNVVFAHSTCHFLPKNRFGTEFNCAMIDSDMAYESSFGAMQYHAYYKFVDQSCVIDKSKPAICHFDVGAIKFHGIAYINFSTVNLCFSFNAHVVDADTPSFLSVDDMDRLEIYYYNLTNLIIHKQSDEKAKVSRA